jgi:hypothetical protein
MKISHRLSALSALSAAALALVAGVSWYAVTSIQSDLQGLTLRAAPLQTKTYELQERTERLMGGLLRLSLARNKDDAGKVLAAVGADSQAIDTLRGEIRTLDPKAATEGADFRGAQREIAGAVDKRLADEAAYQRESESARAALATAEQAVGRTRQAVQQIGVDAGKAADQAQDASRKLATTIKLVMAAQARLREVVVAVSEVDLASNRFRLSPIKDKFKSPLDSIAALQVEAGAEDVLKDLRQMAAGLFDAATKDGSGLLALRAARCRPRPPKPTRPMREAAQGPARPGRAAGGQAGLGARQHRSPGRQAAPGAGSGAETAQRTRRRGRHQRDGVAGHPRHGRHAAPADAGRHRSRGEDRRRRPEEAGRAADGRHEQHARRAVEDGPPAAGRAGRRGAGGDGQRVGVDRPGGHDQAAVAGQRGADGAVAGPSSRRWRRSRPAWAKRRSSA